MAQVLDYSAGKPGALSIVRAGYAGAVRYIGLPGRMKCTDRNEYEDFSRNNLAMALVFEEAAGNWRRGRTQGIIDGTRARDHANAIGFPADRPIYMAIDEDVVTTEDFNSMLAYLHGASTALGGVYVTGVYGEADVIDRARNHKVDGKPVCTWFWQTKAWSRGRVTTAHLRQTIGTVYVGGIGCDTNDVLAEDWGQHNYEGGGVSKQDVIDGLWEFFNGDASRDARNGEGKGRTLLEGMKEANLRAILTDDRTRAMAADLTDDEANIIAAVRQQQANPVDPAAFAAAVAPILAPMLPVGISKEDAKAAALEAVELVFARGAGQ